MRVRWAGAIAVSVAAFGMSAAGARGADPGEQIAALQKIKRSLSPAERKLDSRLAVDLRTKKVATVDVDIRGHAPVRLTADDGRVSYFPRAWVAVTTSDGRTGIGWVEWNRNGGVPSQVT